MLKHVLLAACAGWLVSAVPVVAQETRNPIGSKAAPLAAPPVAKRMNTAPGSKITGARGTIAVALTDSECTTLGGKSVSESACISGKACETTTEAGDWKRVCLSKKE